MTSDADHDWQLTHLTTTRQVPFGAPPGEYAVRKCAPGMSPSKTVSLDLQDTPKAIQSLKDGEIAPDRAAKLRGAKQRTTQVQMLFDREIVPSRVYLSLDATIVFVEGTIASSLALPTGILRPKEAALATYHGDGSRRKLLNCMYIYGQHPAADVDCALLPFDHVYAVDTNTVVHPAIGRLSTTAVVQGKVSRLIDGHTLSDLSLACRVAHLNVDGSPELHALGRLTRRLARLHPVASRRRIAVVTDTELNKIRAMNRQRIAIWAEQYLPTNFSLMYATSDGGATEFTLNKMMRLCDKVARESQAEILASYPSNSFS